jgi:hypothetical protein
MKVENSMNSHALWFTAIGEVISTVALMFGAFWKFWKHIDEKLSRLNTELSAEIQRVDQKVENLRNEVVSNTISIAKIEVYLGLASVGGLNKPIGS